MIRDNTLLLTALICRAAGVVLPVAASPRTLFAEILESGALVVGAPDSDSSPWELLLRAVDGGLGPDLVHRACRHCRSIPDCRRTQGETRSDRDPISKALLLLSIYGAAAKIVEGVSLWKSDSVHGCHHVCSSLRLCCPCTILLPGWYSPVMDKGVPGL